MLAVLLAALLAVHPNSVSSSRVTVDGARVALELRCQVRTLVEALPELDRDDDGELRPSELDAGRSSIEAYVREHYVVHADVADTARSGTALVPSLVHIAPAKGGIAGALPGEALVDFSFELECERAPRSLGLDTTLFRESDPWHRDHAEIAWNGAAPVAKLLWVEEPQWIFRPESAPSGGVVGAYVHLGVEHILLGYDHVAFVLALVVASRRVRALLVVVTAFTLAHSLTLASAAMGWFDLPGNVVEPVIALSIAWVGARNVLAEAPKRLWPEAFGFGLVHGLGFAGAVRETLAAEPEKLGALFGFNVGVEVGQLAIVGVALVLLALLRRGRDEAEGARALAPTGVRRATAACVAVLGLYWFAERVLAA
ncbi:MAG: HupE/UreJ family protein [Planctomycetes bacterium]|nr:HupE/UreJ family protein [Planctomycetota bacterium]